MNKIFILIAIGVSAFAGIAHGANMPGESCPFGYAFQDQILIAETCPGGYISIGTADSCLVASPSGECYMYVPSSTSYTDTIGNTFEYTEACPLS